MSLRSAFGYLRTLARLSARELRRSGTPAEVPGGRIVVERGSLTATTAEIARYLGATDGSRIAAFSGPDAQLPPLLPSTWEAALAAELLCDRRAPSVRRGVVHLGGEAIHVRPIPAADVVRCRLELVRTEREPRGWRISLVGRVLGRAGKVYMESRTTLLARVPADARRGETRKAEEAEEPEEGFSELARWPLRPGHARRYARASGDYNPIHLSRLTALPFGYRRPILHGFCLQAMVAHALIEHRFGGRPERLRRIGIAFRRPVLLPAEIRLFISPAGAHSGRFRVLCEGGVLLAEGGFGGG
jgi:acyl dehydratase